MEQSCLETDHRLQGDIVCLTVWPCFLDTIMTHVDDCLGKPLLVTGPVKCPFGWSPAFQWPVKSPNQRCGCGRAVGDQPHMYALLFCESTFRNLFISPPHVELAPHSGFILACLTAHVSPLLSTGTHLHNWTNCDPTP